MRFTIFPAVFKIAAVLLFQAATAVAQPAAEVAAESGRDPGQTYVLVHGAWGGGWAFRGLADILQSAGHRVYRPTLTGLGERVHLATPEVTLETHVQDVLNLVRFEALERFVLVGHSYGGMVVTVVADRIPQKVKSLVYVDAHLPVNGESMFDLISAERRADLEKRAREQGDGWKILPPWPENGKNVAHPLATFRDQVRLKHSRLPGVAGLYVLTLEPGAQHDAFSASAARARARGWRVVELRTGHNPHWTMPGELARILTSAP